MDLQTKGHTLEELDEVCLIASQTFSQSDVSQQILQMFETGLKPWQTSGWKPSGLSLHGNVHNRADGHASALDTKEMEAEKVELV